MSVRPSNVIDTSSETANMFGCEPCPRCNDNFRVPYNRAEGVVIECDNCGLHEPAEVSE